MMFSDNEDARSCEVPPRRRKSLVRRFCKSDDGAAAIEFAILSIPYFLVIFAILETFIAFAGETLISNAVEDMSRKLRTGQITNIAGRTTYMDEKAFRRAFCGQISILIKCSEAEINTPSKLYIDLRSFSTFADIPKTIPKKTADRFSDIDTTSFAYTPGGARSINMLRVYYRWQVMTDIVRPYITNIRPADGSMPKDFLIVSTAAYQNENYP